VQCVFGLTISVKIISTLDTTSSEGWHCFMPGRVNHRIIWVRRDLSRSSSPASYSKQISCR